MHTRSVSGSSHLQLFQLLCSRILLAEVPLIPTIAVWIVVSKSLRSDHWCLKKLSLFVQNITCSCVLKHVRQYRQPRSLSVSECFVMTTAIGSILGDLKYWRIGRKTLDLCCRVCIFCVSVWVFCCKREDPGPFNLGLMDSNPNFLSFRLWAWDLQVPPWQLHIFTAPPPVFTVSDGGLTPAPLPPGPSK